MEHGSVERGNRFIRNALRVLTPLVLLVTTSIPAANAAPNSDGDYQPDVPSAQDVSPAQNNNFATGQNPCTSGSEVRVGQSDKAEVVLTMDDGPDENTVAAMDAADAHDEHGKITFFEIGDMVKAHPDISRQVIARGYEIGNHSETHSYNPFTIASEIEVMQALVQLITGVTPDYFRSPGLTLSPVIQQKLAQLSMCNILTRVDLRDWITPRISATQICANIKADIKANDILLLHDGGNHAQTILALQTCLFPTLRDLGLEVVTLKQFLSGVQICTNNRDKCIPSGPRIADTSKLTGRRTPIRAN